MSARKALFLNQQITIESEVQGNGSGVFTLSCPINEAEYMSTLLDAVQNWRPRGFLSPIATDARIENNQVICSLTPQNTAEDRIDAGRMDGTLVHDLVRHIESGASRAMGASVAGTMTGEDDYEMIRGT
jgi:hypothetical protein